MFLYSVISLLIGVVILSCSIVSLHRICKRSPTKGWCLLRLLVVFFVFGYLGYLNYLMSSGVTTVADTLVSSIMLGGSVFVILVSRYSHRSLLEISELAAIERFNSLHDALTGLPNRQNFHQYLPLCQQSQSLHCLCLIDLNGFKKINDGLGHYYGDQLLRQIASRFMAMADPSRLKFFRIGGDEFALIVRCSAEDSLENAITAVTNELVPEFELDEYSVAIQAAVGCVFFSGVEESEDTLIKRADLALYKNKLSDESFSVFSKSMEIDDDNKILLRSKLKTAIKERKLVLYYQPIIETNSNNIVGMEALLRWPQEDGTLISPDVFIPLAEQDTTINAITQYVLQQAAEDLLVFQSENVNLDLHLNLSAKDLQDPELYQHILFNFLNKTSIDFYLLYR